MCLQKRVCLLGLVIAVELGLSLPLSAQQPEAAQVIVRDYRQADAAVERKDLTGIYADYAANYTAVPKEGLVVSLAQIRQQVQQVLPMARAIHSVSAPGAVHVSGRTATVTVHNRLDLILFNPKKPTIYAPISLRNTSEDRWQNTGGQWLLLNSRVTNQTLHYGHIHGLPPQADTQTQFQTFWQLRQMNKSMMDARMDEMLNSNPRYDYTPDFAGGAYRRPTR